MYILIVDYCFGQNNYLFVLLLPNQVMMVYEIIN